MENITCFECGNPAHVQHHVVPKSKGGRKTVPLCDSCHSIVHDARLMGIGELSRRGKDILRESNNRDKVIELHKQGIGKSEIAKTIGINRKAVYSILEENGLHINEGKGCEMKVTTETLDRIKLLRELGKSWQYIENEIDICHTHLYRLIREHKLNDGKYNTSKINRQTYMTVPDDAIEQAKQLREEGRTWDEIATMLGTNRETLHAKGITKLFKPLRGQMTEEKKSRAVVLRQQGKTWKTVAEELGVSVGTLRFHGLHKEETILEHENQEAQ